MCKEGDIMQKYIGIQNEVIKANRITIVENSKCYSRTHAHIKQRKVCKWKQCNSIASTFTLFHEIGHIVNNSGNMRRCEREYYATVWALEKFKDYGLVVPEDIVRDYQEYIYRELERGIRRGGSNYPSREELLLKV
jgi:hypothetical protein